MCKTSILFSSVTNTVTHLIIFISSIENAEIQPEVHKAKVLKQLIALALSCKCTILVHGYARLHYCLPWGELLQLVHLEKMFKHLCPNSGAQHVLKQTDPEIMGFLE